MYLLIFCIIILYFFYFYRREHFTLDSYDKFRIGHINREQKYLDFLNELNDEYKSRKKDLQLKDLCNDKINIEIQKQSLKSAFKKPKNNKECAYKASNICEFIDPYLYLSESKNFPPPWIVKSYKDLDLPKHVDINCF